ncbi:MAG: DUF309 domain-containing protein [candidate division WOR-3 bacterium]|nr:DUF309 domain-containing protein [candidate division WOR-3 bacterium]MCX7947287.1 DUF309 domain-containing protein [candidate division WOR-3 bacterium]MDW8150156.1 DUF309 domain-containing protein [candidate division WOR-3 bacterium]
MKVGFVGLGNLGKAIVDRMISQGINLYVYNRAVEKAKNYNHFLDPNELFYNSDVIFIIIRDSKAVEELLFKRIEPQNIENKIIVDMTTNSYSFVKKFYQKVRELNGYYFEAPLLGSIPAANTGSLVMLISGDKSRLKLIEHIIETFTKKFYYFDNIGEPTKLKLLNNFALAGILQSIMETITIGENMGIRKDLILEILSNGAGRSYFLEVKKEKILNEDFSPQFSIELLHKDLNYFFELINDFHLYSHILEPTNKILERAVNLNHGSLDISGVYLVLKKNIFNDERFIKGLELLRTGDYFEAHEVLEDLWREMPVENKYRNFIKGIIQICAGYYKHIEQRNPNGARNIFINAKNYLSKYLEENQVIDVKKVIANIEKIIGMIDKNEDISSFKIIE